jgi:hypothetical protein
MTSDADDALGWGGSYGLLKSATTDRYEVVGWSGRNSSFELHSVGAKNQSELICL